MNTRPTTIERAFQLARSGKCRSFADISRTLQKEGYGDARAQLYGPSLKRQLAALTKEACKQEDARSP